MPDLDHQPGEGAPRRRVRRAPNFAQFMITGGVVGLLLGLWIGSRGESGSYSSTTAMGFFGLIFAALGVLVASLVAVLLDRRSVR